MVTDFNQPGQSTNQITWSYAPHSWMALAPKNHPLISFCIPTYNFGEFIGECIDSIVSQPIPDALFEIVILDSNSQDHTDSVVASRMNGSAPIRFGKAQKRQGIDVDLATVVAAATGEFCWLFSADDALAPNALKEVLDEISSISADVFLINHTNCDRTLRPINVQKVFRNERPLTNLGSTEQRAEYFRSAVSSDALFGFMSSVIVKRKFWNQLPFPQDFAGSCWAHSARLFQGTTRDSLLVNFIHRPLLHKRGENDSFMANGPTNRLKIQIHGLLRVMSTTFGANSIEVREMRRILRREVPTGLWLLARLEAHTNTSNEKRIQIQQMWRELYGHKLSVSWLRGSPLILTPVVVIKMLKIVRNHVRSTTKRPERNLNS